jgi:hypothetical protein
MLVVPTDILQHALTRLGADAGRRRVTGGKCCGLLNTVAMGPLCLSQNGGTQHWTSVFRLQTIRKLKGLSSVGARCAQRRAGVLTPRLLKSIGRAISSLKGTRKPSLRVQDSLPARLRSGYRSTKFPHGCRPTISGAVTYHEELVGRVIKSRRWHVIS